MNDKPAPASGPQLATFQPATRSRGFGTATRIPLKNSLSPTTPPPIFTTFDKILKD
jgi:hypothetical protein